MRALLLLLWGANRIVNNKNLGFSHICCLLILVTPYVSAQAPETASDATVTYPAEYFAQFNPYSVNDMLQRIPESLSRAAVAAVRAGAVVEVLVRRRASINQWSTDSRQKQ